MSSDTDMSLHALCHHLVELETAYNSSCISRPADAPPRRRIVFGPITDTFLAELRAVSVFAFPSHVEASFLAGVGKAAIIGIVFDPTESPFPMDWKAAAPWHIQPLLKNPLVVPFPIVIRATSQLPQWQPDVVSRGSSNEHFDVSPRTIAGGHPVHGTLFPALQQHQVDTASVEARQQLEWAAQLYLEHVLEQSFALQPQPTDVNETEPKICVVSAETIDLICDMFHPVTRVQKNADARREEVQRSIVSYINEKPLPSIPLTMLQQPSAFPRAPMESLLD